MPETTPLIKAALNLRGGAGFDVYVVKMMRFLYDCRKLNSKGGISDIKLVKKAVMLKNGTEYRMPVVENAGENM